MLTAYIFANFVSSSADTLRLPASISETQGRCRPSIFATCPWDSPACSRAARRRAAKVICVGKFSMVSPLCCLQYLGKTITDLCNAAGMAFVEEELRVVRQLMS